MKRLILLMLVLTVLMAGTAGAADKELNIFIWSEYMPESLWKNFEKQTGIKVRLDYYENNEEMLAKLQAGATSQYDIIVPSDYILPSLITLKLIQPLKQADLTNLKNLKEMFKKTNYDTGNKYSVAWQWGTVGLMYRKDKVKNFENTWAMIFDPKKEIGPFWLIDSVREQMGIPLLYKGYDFNSTKPEELKAASDLLIETKKNKNCLGFKAGVGGKNDVVAGTAVAAVVYNGDALRAISEDKTGNLIFTVPKEGSEIWFDSMCIPAKAPNVEAAHKWINFVLDPKNGAELSNYNQYATPNEASMAFINPDDLKNPNIYPSPEVMKTLHFTKDLGKDLRIVDEAWTRAKSN
ncbi:MAG: spermidine/putrescine ABC transporter substrate-binding protein [Deltaproteobacteria bacterium]|nr:spermidine/putrescine ABC transporter substrate-binding protein [Deltaproteobacteria bacterium]